MYVTGGNVIDLQPSDLASGAVNIMAIAVSRLPTSLGSFV